MHICVHIQPPGNRFSCEMNFSWLLALLLPAIISPAQAWNCPCGSFCPDPVKKYKAPILCPAGSYCTEGGFNQTSFPIQCPAGYQCPRQGLCAPRVCPSSSFCVAGSSRPVPCPANTTCPANSSTPVQISPHLSICSAQQFDGGKPSTRLFIDL